MNDRLRNQTGLLDEKRLAESRILVVGAGAIGSFAVTALAKMGAKHITVYDMDTIENHNIANQLFPVTHIGETKVSALRTVAQAYGEMLINVVEERWSPQNAQEADIIIAAVDNMDVRKEIWDHYKARCKFFVDGRMAAQVMRVYGVDTGNGEAVSYYEGTLYPQSEAEPERCGHKSIIYTVLMVSGEICAQIKRYLMGEHRPTEVLYDAYNADVVKKYHMERVIEVIYAPEETEVPANA